MPYVLSSLMDLRSLNFQVVQLLSCCEDRNDNFQTLHMSELKQEVTSLSLNKRYDTLTTKKIRKHITSACRTVFPKKGQLVTSTKHVKMYMYFENISNTENLTTENFYSIKSNCFLDTTQFVDPYLRE